MKSKRLLLVPISLKYKKEIFNEFTPEITLLMNPKPAKDIKEVEKFISTSRNNMLNGKEYVCAILNKRTKTFLGCGGLHRLNTRRPELGIWVKKSAHGHKYGREAMKTLKQWADTNLDFTYIVYPVAKDNVPSRKIAESLGGKIEKEYNKKNTSGRMINWLEYRIGG